jgi:uncharacterized protein (TIGR02246 family)
MRTRILARGFLAATALAVVIAVAGCGSDAEDPAPASPTTATAEDEEAVRGLLDQINAAWARGDATEYASFHTPDADLIDFRGVHAVGHQGIVDLLQPAFDTVLAGTHVEAEIVDFRFLAPEVAIFHTEGEIVPTGDHSIQTFVATKGDEGWRIAAFQNTRIQPAPAE